MNTPYSAAAQSPLLVPVQPNGLLCESSHLPEAWRASIQNRVCESTRATTETCVRSAGTSTAPCPAQSVRASLALLECPATR
nr:MAG: hypothetical protein [Molluscum contagiosum virus]